MKNLSTILMILLLLLTNTPSFCMDPPSEGSSQEVKPKRPFWVIYKQDESDCSFEVPNLKEEDKERVRCLWYANASSLSQIFMEAGFKISYVEEERSSLKEVDQLVRKIDIAEEMFLLQHQEVQKQLEEVSFIESYDDVTQLPHSAVLKQKRDLIDQSIQVLREESEKKREELTQDFEAGVKALQELDAQVQKEQKNSSQERKIAESTEERGAEDPQLAQQELVEQDPLHKYNQDRFQAFYNFKLYFCRPISTCRADLSVEQLRKDISKSIIQILRPLSALAVYKLLQSIGIEAYFIATNFIKSPVYLDCLRGSLLDMHEMQQTLVTLKAQDLQEASDISVANIGINKMKILHLCSYIAWKIEREEVKINMLNRRRREIEEESKKLFKVSIGNLVRKGDFGGVSGEKMKTHGAIMKGFEKQIHYLGEYVKSLNRLLKSLFEKLDTHDADYDSLKARLDSITESEQELASLVEFQKKTITEPHTKEIYTAITSLPNVSDVKAQLLDSLKPFIDKKLLEIVNDIIQQHMDLIQEELYRNRILIPYCMETFVEDILEHLEWRSIDQGAKRQLEKVCFTQLGFLIGEVGGPVRHELDDSHFPDIDL